MTSASHRTRAFLVAEIVLFSLASLLHRGILARGFEHARAAVAEAILAVVLAVGLAITVYSPNEGRPAALWTQGLALLGVCVGAVLIFVGVGPETGLDVGIHAVMAMVLIAGLFMARRPKPDAQVIDPAG